MADFLTSVIIILILISLMASLILALFLGGFAYLLIYMLKRITISKGMKKEDANHYFGRMKYYPVIVGIIAFFLCLIYLYFLLFASPFSR